MTDRRGTYFAFQGLFMAVLLLLFLYQYRLAPGWILQFTLLAALLGATLALVRLATEETLFSWWFQAGLFVGDSFLAWLTLQWAPTQSDIYLIYLLIILGTAVTRNLIQSFLVGFISSFLYILSVWNPSHGLAEDSEFWLRILFLLVTTALLAILSRDTRRVETDQERRFREKLVQFERLAALGQVAGEVAHSIKGPLTTIMVDAEVLSHRYGKFKDLVREMKQIGQEANRCKNILKNLLDLGRLEEMDFTLLDLRDPLRSAIEAARRQTEQYGIQLETAGLETPAYVRGDSSLLHEAIAGLLQNAIDAIRLPGRSSQKTSRARGTGRDISAQYRALGNIVRGQLSPKDVSGGGQGSDTFSRGKIQITLKACGSGRWWDLSRFRKLHSLSVQDNGHGIDSKDFDRIFQPFFTTKGREGSGLGLSAALRILQKHGGAIEAATPKLGQGASFTMMIPPAEIQGPPSKKRSR